ncbi:DUF4362 domain-containing protein [Sporosarcina sp. E16_8]|nr:DUF4362 domain-containing protein [Sporosarcina sp. E16_8]MBO0588808.1 DUF4362 domain-containing protein [Sporosarcina sp. E16_8]
MLLATLVACQSVKDSDIVFSQEGEITSNLDKLLKFIQNVENGNEDTIHIVRRTTEGDPIFDTLDYNGESIKYSHDNSKDKFGGSDKGVTNTTCTDLGSENTEKGIKYSLTGCSSNIGKYFDFEIPE